VNGEDYVFPSPIRSDGPAVSDSFSRSAVLALFQWHEANLADSLLASHYAPELAMWSQCFAAIACFDFAACSKEPAEVASSFLQVQIRGQRLSAPSHTSPTTPRLP